MDGNNDGKIGLLMSQIPERAQESLEYLSQALYQCYAQIYEVCIGYVNAYGVLERLAPAEELIHWLLSVGHGLQQTGQICSFHKTDVRLYTILATLRLLQGDEAQAYALLRQARETALLFDQQPCYQFGRGMKFYHITKDTTAYDDMGETAMATIENYLADESAGKLLRPLWAKLCREE